MPSLELTWQQIEVKDPNGAPVVGFIATHFMLSLVVSILPSGSVLWSLFDRTEQRVVDSGKGTDYRVAMGDCQVSAGKYSEQVAERIAALCCASRLMPPPVTSFGVDLNRN